MSWNTGRSTGKQAAEELECGPQMAQMSADEMRKAPGEQCLPERTESPYSSQQR
jgi:hypothetical protein